MTSKQARAMTPGRAYDWLAQRGLVKLDYVLEPEGQCAEALFGSGMRVIGPLSTPDESLVALVSAFRSPRREPKLEWAWVKDLGTCKEHTRWWLSVDQNSTGLWTAMVRENASLHWRKDFRSQAGARRAAMLAAERAMRLRKVIR